MGKKTETQRTAKKIAKKTATILATKALGIVAKIIWNKTGGITAAAALGAVGLSGGTAIAVLAGVALLAAGATAAYSVYRENKANKTQKHTTPTTTLAATETPKINKQKNKQANNNTVTNAFDNKCAQSSYLVTATKPVVLTSKQVETLSSPRPKL